MTAADIQHEQTTQSSRGMADVLWLAGEDIRRTWPSYPGSALYLLFLGLLFGLADSPGIGTFPFEFIMLAIGTIMATPFFAREYMSWSTDPIAERLAWLRVLPIGVPTIVRARAVAIIVALPINALAFFTPAWFGGRWGLDTGTFLWFILAMCGVAFAGAGLTLVLEMSVGIRRWIITNIVSLVVVIVVMGVLGLWFDIRLFEQLARGLEWNGPLVALACVAAGIAVFLACLRLAEDGLRRRELTP